MYYIICTSRIIRTFNRRKFRKRNDTPRFDVSNYKLEWENSQRFDVSSMARTNANRQFLEDTRNVFQFLGV